jgi:hypothetical protein
VFREALGYPLRGDDGLTAVLLGGGVLFAAGLFLPFGILFFPLFGVSFALWLSLQGYYVRVLRWSAAGRSDPPGIDDVGGMLGDGLGAVLVTIGYALPTLVLLGVAGTTGLLAAAGGSAGVESALRGVTGIAVLFVLLYLLALAYVLPAAVTLFAYHDSVGAAFRVRTVLDGAFSEDYAVGWVFALLLRVVGYPAALLSSALLVGPFVWVYVAIAARNLHGRSFRDALDLGPLPDETATTADTGPPSPAAGAARGPHSSRPDDSTDSHHPSASESVDPADTPRRSALESDLYPMAEERHRDRDT